MPVTLASSAKRELVNQLFDDIRPCRNSFSKSKFAWTRMMGFYLASLSYQIRKDLVTPASLEFMASQIKLMVDAMKNGRRWEDKKINALDELVLGGMSRENLRNNHYLRKQPDPTQPGARADLMDPSVCDRMSEAMDHVIESTTCWTALNA